MGDRRIAVVGGGLAGLIAAIHAARAGASVTLYEAAPQLGGRARTRVLEGFSFNQGPHALYLAGALYRALGEFGIQATGGPPDLASGWALWPSTRTLLPIGIRQDALGSAFAQAMTTLLTAEREGRLGVGRSSLSLAQALELVESDARPVIEALVRLSTYAHAPDQIDARAALAQLRLSASGTIYVDHGWGTLIDRLVSAARAAAVEMCPKIRVKRVSADGKGQTLELAGEARETFASVILALPPTQAAAVLPGSAELAAALEAMVPVRIAGLDIALSALPEADTRFALGMHEPTYFSVHSAAARLAPDGGAMCHVARYLAPGEQPFPAHFEELDNLLDALQPGWGTVLVYSQRLSGATVACDFPQAALGGRRQPEWLGDSPGVFLAGDWVGQEGMLADASAASARAAAEAACAFAYG